MWYGPDMSSCSKGLLLAWLLVSAPSLAAADERRTSSAVELRRASHKVSAALGTRVQLRRGVTTSLQGREVLVTPVPSELTQRVECSPMIVDPLPQCEASRDPLLLVVPSDASAPRAFRVRTQGYDRLGLNRFDVHVADMDGDLRADLVITAELFLLAAEDELVLRGDVLVVLALHETPRVLGEERISICRNVEGMRVCDVRTMQLTDTDADGRTELRIDYDGEVASWDPETIEYPRTIAFEYDPARGTLVRSVLTPPPAP
jgi:hypothetical protein